MYNEESWLMEILSSQKRTLLISLGFIVITIASIPVGLLLLRPESAWGLFGSTNKPPIEIVDYSALAYVIITIGFLLLLGGIYLWYIYTPAGIQNQLTDLKELMSAKLVTKRHVHHLYLPDGLK